MTPHARHMQITGATLHESIYKVFLYFPKKKTKIQQTKTSHKLVIVHWLVYRFAPFGWFDEKYIGNTFKFLHVRLFLLADLDIFEGELKPLMTLFFFHVIRYGGLQSQKMAKNYLFLITISDKIGVATPQPNLNPLMQ